MRSLFTTLQIISQMMTLSSKIYTIMSLTVIIYTIHTSKIEKLREDGKCKYWVNRLQVLHVHYIVCYHRFTKQYRITYFVTVTC